MFKRSRDMEDRWDIDIAMNNSYNVIVNQYDAFLIIKTGKGWFAHNPREELNIEDVYGILEYFEDQEDFDKCKELNKIIKWNLEIIKEK